jgi:MarR family 2-MHQ and catechol resistance regulon transcriptional repressor
VETIEREILSKLSLFYMQVKRKLNSSELPEGLTITDFMVLNSLMNGKKTMVEISKEINVTQSSITLSISKLEEKDIVKRIRYPSDRRITFVEITDKGKEVVSSCQNKLNVVLLECIGNLSHAEKRNLLEILKKLNC